MNDWREFWRRRRAANIALLPFAAMFAAVSGGRRMLYRRGILKSKQCGAPVVVVGNITAGGGGKTPIVIALAAALQKRGAKVGIVSRGYGGNFGGEKFVDANDNWRQVGDEPLLIKRKTNLPVCVGKNRYRAARMLADAGCTMIISDDGLQHYRMARCAEVCAMRGDYLFGNGFFLPAGPLRESWKRAGECTLSAIVNIGGGNDGIGGGGGDNDNHNDYHNDNDKTASPPAPPENPPDDMLDNASGHLPHNAVPVVLKPDVFYHVQKPDAHLPPQWFADKQTAAFAGTANPREFLAMLKGGGICPQTFVAIADHGVMTRQQLDNIKADAVLTTEKDALKYPHHSRLYAVSLRAVLPPQMIGVIAAAAGI